MGNNCAGAREKFNQRDIMMNALKSGVKDRYNRAKQRTADGYAAAKEKARIKYDESKLRWKGYREQLVEDESETGIITKFEDKMVIKKVSIDEFDRRIKKFIDGTEEITEKQLIEAFADHPQMGEITNEESLTRKLLTHPMLKDNPSNSTFHIPNLMLVAILFCAQIGRAHV